MTGPGIPISTLFENESDRGTENTLPVSGQSIVFLIEYQYSLCRSSNVAFRIVTKKPLILYMYKCYKNIY